MDNVAMTFRNDPVIIYMNVTDGDWVASGNRQVLIDNNQVLTACDWVRGGALVFQVLCPEKE